MKGSKLTLFYILFFIVAGLTVSVIVFEKPIRTITRASSAVTSATKSVIIADKLQASPQKDTVLITVYARNEQGDVLQNKSVSVLGDGGVFSPQSATTDQNGKAIFRLQSQKEGIITVKTVIDGVDVANNVIIYFK